MDNNAGVRPIAHPIPAACRSLGIGRTKLYALIASGDLDARRIGGRTVILDASMLALAQRAERVGGPA